MTMSSRTAAPRRSGSSGGFLRSIYNLGIIIAVLLGTTTTTLAQDPQLTTTTTTTPNILETANNAGFNILVEAISLASPDITTALSSTNDYTVLAPTNEAFANLPPEDLDYLLTNTDMLTKVLLYHVISGSITVDDMPYPPLPSFLNNNVDDTTSSVSGGMYPTLLLEESVKLEKMGDQYAICLLLIFRECQVTVSVNDDVEVILSDIQTSNGIIHAIDEVLIPESIQVLLPSSQPVSSPTPPDGQQVEVEPETEEDDDSSSFNTFRLGLALIGGTLFLNGLGSGPYTILAPTDEAFDALGSDTWNSLITDLPRLNEVLKYHIIQGTYTASDIATTLLNQDVVTINGNTISLTQDDIGNIFINNEAQVILTDITSGWWNNDLIHGIDTVLLPPPSPEGQQEEDCGFLGLTCLWNDLFPPSEEEVVDSPEQVPEEEEDDCEGRPFFSLLKCWWESL